MAVVFIGGAVVVFPAYFLVQIVLSILMMLVRIAALYDLAAGKRWSTPCV